MATLADKWWIIFVILILHIWAMKLKIFQFYLLASCSLQDNFREVFLGVLQWKFWWQNRYKVPVPMNKASPSLRLGTRSVTKHIRFQMNNLLSEQLLSVFHNIILNKGSFSVVISPSCSDSALRIFLSLDPSCVFECIYKAW